MVLNANYIFGQSKFGLTDVVELNDSKLFVNITKTCFVLDNERYYPSLFTAEFPKTLTNYYTYSFDMKLIYAFDFEQDQHIYFLENLKRDLSVGKSILAINEDTNMILLSRDSTNQLLQTWITSREDELLSHLVQEYPVDGNVGKCYLAKKENVLVVFYNIVDLEVNAILSSFILIKPKRHEFLPIGNF